MDPVSMIVMAVAAGAAAGLKPTAEAAIKDAYAGLKALIKQRYASVDVEALERKPQSEPTRAYVGEGLTEAGAGQDVELIEQARTLADLVDRTDPAAAAAVGIDIKKLRAAFVDVGDITAEGTGVRGQEWDIEGGIRIGDIRAGAGGTGSTDPR